MSNQDMQLEIMAEGGFDVNTNSELLSEQEVLDLVFGLDYFTPERVAILHEQVESNMNNPCTYCACNDSTDTRVLDFCHYHCQEEDVQPISD